MLKIPSAIVFGGNNVTTSSLYVNANAHGLGTQNVTIDLWEADAWPYADDKIVTINPPPTAARPPNCIKDTAIQIAAGGTVTFVVTNTSGTISGNAGTNEANEDPVQLMYGYDPGTGMDYSPVKEVNVTQP